MLLRVLPNPVTSKVAVSDYGWGRTLEKLAESSADSVEDAERLHDV